MCGLTGIVVTKPELIPIELVKAIFSLLMEENDDRGGHAWGAWGSGIEPIRALGKYSAAPFPLHAHLEGFRYNDDGTPTFLFGHTRFGTHGEKTVDNAHPFVYGTLTLAHNGVVSVDGYDAKDHPVDSGRIAIAVAEHGWTAGLAKVEGMCALLATVGNQPLVYRHDQVLNYAEFEWGSVICSTLYDLELVIKKKLGMKPIKVDSVPENVLCQPGFGTVWHEAPAKARRSLSSGFQGHWWDGYSDEECGFGCASADTEWSYKERKYVPKTRETRVVGFQGKDFSGKSDLPTQSKFHGGDTLTPVAAEGSRLKYVDKDGDTVDDVVDMCEYCGYHDISIDDLYVCITDWSAGEPVQLCMDCITDEITKSGSIRVVGPYNMDPEQLAVMVQDAELVTADFPPDEDRLSAQDKADLEDYIKANYRSPRDV